MRRALALRAHVQAGLSRGITTKPLIDITKATFFRTYPSSQDNTNITTPLFEDITYSLPSDASQQEFWAIKSPCSIARTNFLQVLGGQHIALPALARRYPYLSDQGVSPQQAITYVGFDADRGNSVGGTSVRGAYLSARYESRRESTDFSVRDYLLGNTELNALDRDTTAEEATLDDVAAQLNLGELLDMPVSNLSNGQTRRARIAKALMSRPELLLLDGPFMGLDPGTVIRMSLVLQRLAQAGQPRLVISLRPEDKIPDWINRVLVIDEHSKILAQDERTRIEGSNDAVIQSIIHHSEVYSQRLSRDGFPHLSPALKSGETLIDMQGVKVSYGERTVLGAWQQDLNGELRDGLWWSLQRGQRCGIFGPNGSGKTTMLSLITSDHPKTYGQPIKLFGRSRVPEKGELGISLFDLQKRMGHSSPEVHAFFPRGLTLRRTLESAWADAPLARPKLDETAKQRIDSFLQWFSIELAPSSAAQRTQQDNSWADKIDFGELSFTNQRLALFLRAIVAQPDLVILDEAFSGMDETTRDKALLFLAQGETVKAVVDGRATTNGEGGFRGLTSEQALLVISHAKEDVPGCIREWVCLPEPGEGRRPRTGTLDGPLELNPAGWKQIWGS